MLSPIARLLLSAATIAAAIAAPPAPLLAWDDVLSAETLDAQFKRTVLPFLQQYCIDCHGEVDPEAKLDLRPYQSRSAVSRDHRTWVIVMERLQAGEMPPADAEPLPTAQQRMAIVEWIQQQRSFDANRHAGDPGLVLTRRLSNAEYNHAVRDLTGVDIRPTRSFPVDPANEAGFDNSGESLTVSPALLQKHLAAAAEVASHLVLTPTGMDFAEHPAITHTDRDKHCVKRIVAFYRRQPTDLADYFETLVKMARQRSAAAARGKPAPSVDVWLAEAEASGAKIRAKYAAAVWRHLNQQDPVGPNARLQGMFQAATQADQPQVRRQSEQMRDYVVQTRRRIAPQFDNLEVRGSHKGSQPFVLWKNRQYAKYRRSFVREKFAESAAAKDWPTELTPPEDDAAERAFWEAMEEFCRVFPDAFYISERGRDYLGKPREQQEKGRLLSAGFHSMMGYFRDDQPLYDLILNGQERRQLDAMWDELNFVASAISRQYVGFLWFERTDSRYMRDPEFDFARAEDKSAGTAPMIRKLAKLYRAKAERNGGSATALGAIDRYFDDINRLLRKVERQQAAAQPIHLRELERFASRAWRRPLTPAELADIRATYDALRAEAPDDDPRSDYAQHEQAVRDTLTTILMSPHFLFRVDLGSTAGEGMEGAGPLDPVELASRLSFFLWASMPDDDVRRTLAASPESVEQVASRMLQDERVRGMATEFAANWLGIRQFEQHNSVDRERFPSFTNELRSAMYEEPLRLFIDVAQGNTTMLDLLEGEITFVNPVLAKHYGMEAGVAAGDTWQRVDAAAAGRGGLLPMAVFLTQNSPGLRTSPVKRGYWVVRRLLGERIPPPPPNVPELPADESQLGDRTLRETLEMHRAHQSCAGCHNRFDSLGLAFEGYGPIGERRERDLAGRPVQTTADFPVVHSSESGREGMSGNGVEGLRRYLQLHRRDEFIDNFCRKLLTYALSRSLMLSDEPLIAKMKERLKSDGYRFESLVTTIVRSPQFLTKRVPRRP